MSPTNPMPWLALPPYLVTSPCPTLCVAVLWAQSHAAVWASPALGTTAQSSALSIVLGHTLLGDRAAPGAPQSAAGRAHGGIEAPGR